MGRTGHQQIVIADDQNVGLLGRHYFIMGIFTPLSFAH